MSIVSLKILNFIVLSTLLHPPNTNPTTEFYYCKAIPGFAINTFFLNNIQEVRLHSYW